MLYFPSRVYAQRFRLMASPLPRRLLEYLFSRGLGIYFLPRRADKARRFYHDQLGFSSGYLGNGRDFMEIAFYSPETKRIVIPHQAAFENPFGNVLLHEIGHAFDFIFDYAGYRISSYPEVVKALRPKKPLTPYCRVQDEASGMLLEQFGYSFEAYFQEPEADLSQLHIGLLDKRLIKLMNGLINPFRD